MRILNDRVMIKPIMPKKKTNNGIIIADYEDQSKYIREVYSNVGEIIDVGTNVRDLKAGETIIFYRWGAEAYDINGQDIMFVSEKDVVAKVTEE